MQNIENAEIKNVIEEVKKIVEAYWWENMFEEVNSDLYTRLENTLANYLRDDKIHKSFADFSVHVYEYKYTWAKLYPNIFKRYIVIFCSDILHLNMYSSKIKWYHHILPYKIRESWTLPYDIFRIVHNILESNKVTDEDMRYLATFVKNIEEFAKKDTRYATLGFPHTTIQADIKIQPIKAAEYINVKMHTNFNIKQPVVCNL